MMSLCHNVSGVESQALSTQGGHLDVLSQQQDVKQLWSKVLMPLQCGSPEGDIVER